MLFYFIFSPVEKKIRRRRRREKKEEEFDFPIMNNTFVVYKDFSCSFVINDFHAIKKTNILLYHVA